jgi:hypothetical protein
MRKILAGYNKKVLQEKIIKEGSSAGLERKNIGIVERKRLLPRVRGGTGVQKVVMVTTARWTVVVHVYQKGESVL